MENTEVELKFPLYNLEDISEKLKSMAVLEKKGVFQKDTYYIPAHRNFLEKKPISEWLRLRETKNGFTINYKKWHNEKGNAVSCDEFQTGINDLEKFKNILKRLDFKEIIVVEKQRDVWKMDNVNILIDRVNELGNFIELEASGNFSKIEEAKNHLYLILKKINASVGEQDFEGYPFKVMRKNGLL